MATLLQRFLQKDKARIDSKIYNYYKSFKEFICCKDLPDFIIQYTDSRLDCTIDYVAQIFPYRKPIILKCNISLLNEKSEDFKATLVHEFTHLYDYYNQSLHYEDEFLKNNLWIYSEYHAVQIEILFCYHIIKKITDYADFMKTNLITMLDLPITKFQIYKDFAFKYMDNPSTYNFYRMKSAYMYACGACGLLTELMEEKFEVIAFMKPYDKKMNEIVELLSSVKYNQVPSGELLQKIGDIDSQMKI